LVDWNISLPQFIDQQNREPQPVCSDAASIETKMLSGGYWQGAQANPRGAGLFWVYKNAVCQILAPLKYEKVEDFQLAVKHHVLREERKRQQMQREVDALTNGNINESPRREPIPEAVRMFVWRRDNGKCTRCGGRQRLEFDHIIPVSAGGGSTARSIQLLCEYCNRSKGATV
jgi:hypothetical protein